MNRFWEKVNKTSTCWNWTGSLSDGYGRYFIKGRFNKAHRFSYYLHKGAILKGLQVLHQCNNRACVNPDHLYLGTHGDNMRDRKLAGMYHKDLNGRTKVSEKQAKLLKEVYENFIVSYTTLAKVAGIDKTAIASIIKGEE